jgi:hypothetical protein
MQRCEDESVTDFVDRLFVEDALDTWTEIFPIMIATIKLNPNIAPLSLLVKLALLNRNSYRLVKDHRIRVKKFLDIYAFDKANRAFEPVALELKPAYYSIVKGKVIMTTNSRNLLPNSTPVDLPEIQWLRLDKQNCSIDYTYDSYIKSAKRRCASIESIPCTFLYCCHITMLKIHWFFSWDIYNLPEELERLTIITDLAVKQPAIHCNKKLFLSNKTRIRYLEYTYGHFGFFSKESSKSLFGAFPESITEVKVMGGLRHTLINTAPKMITRFTVLHGLPEYNIKDLECSGISIPQERLRDTFFMRSLRRLSVYSIGMEALCVIRTSNLVVISIGSLCVHWHSEPKPIEFAEFAEDKSATLKSCFPETLRELCINGRNYGCAELVKNFNVPSNLQKLELRFKIANITFDADSKLHTFYHTSNSEVDAYPLSLQHLTVNFEHRSSDTIAGSKLPSIKTLGLLNCHVNFLKRAPPSLKKIYTYGNFLEPDLAPGVAKLGLEICKVEPGFYL